jgi:hypothetical protein
VHQLLRVQTVVPSRQQPDDLHDKPPAMAAFT